MSATKTLAFILGARDYRDTSILGDFYTREHGKIRGIVRGIRDARGRFGSTLEPFSLNEILFYKRRRGGDLHQVTQVELMDLFPAVREDLERLAYASYFTELLNELVEVEEPSPEIFDLFSDSLAFLASGASPKRVARVFEVKFFESLGLMPEVRSCVVCNAELPEPAYFNVALGGIRCKSCSTARLASPAGQEHEQTGLVGIPVSRGTLNFLDHVRRADVKDLYKVKVSQEVGEELEKTLRRFVDFHLNAKLKSMVFLEKMGY
ncbi:MAG TPA: DNA repair protein RecO [Candidatus Eisenbacteria bacterium]|nr:DNA repair protein RecO [Candidatus Eisenbacteria bacterium]